MAALAMKAFPVSGGPSNKMLVAKGISPIRVSKPFIPVVYPDIQIPPVPYFS
jgi:hypothetical protein